MQKYLNSSIFAYPILKLKYINRNHSYIFEQFNVNRGELTLKYLNKMFEENKFNAKNVKILVRFHVKYVS